MTSGNRCGYVALVGRPNVGKSTLLNHLLGQKISITSRKPQTTRHQTLGIKTTDTTQFVFVDTPGIHKTRDRALNRYMNKAASSAVQDVDVVVFLVDRIRWTDEDELVLEQLKQADVPVILAINKIDQLSDKSGLLPFIEKLLTKGSFTEVVPVSALKGEQVDTLEEVIAKHLPEGDWFYPEDQVTDRSQRFLAAEIVREKVMRQLGQEIPYQVTVEIEQFKVEQGVTHIHALILVEKAGQKAIVIGKGGERLKKIGSDAREAMEKLLECKVMLNLWVKVKSGWSDDERALRSLGYNDT